VQATPLFYIGQQEERDENDESCPAQSRYESQTDCKAKELEPQEIEMRH